MTENELNQLKYRIDKAKRLKRQIGELESDLTRLHSSPNYPPPPIRRP